MCVYSNTVWAGRVKVGAGLKLILSDVETPFRDTPELGSP